MMRPIEGIDPAGIGPAVLAPAVGPVGLVGGVIGIGELVVLRFRDPAERHPQSRPAAEAFPRQTAVEVLVKQPVMPQFVSGDVPAYLLQYRLGRRFAQRGVVGASADLDDAARHHLA